MKVFVKKVENIQLPKKATEGSSGYDIVATSDPRIVGNQVGNLWKSIDYIEYETDLYFAPEFKSYHILNHPRSSVSKYNLVLANSIGLIDNDYRRMVRCRFKYIWQPEDLEWTSNGMLGKINIDKIYNKGEAIAQLLIEPTVEAEWELVDDLTETKRGEGGFGSTSKTKGPSLEEIYNKIGGISVKEKYSEEVRKRESLT